MTLLRAQGGVATPRLRVRSAGAAFRRHGWSLLFLAPAAVWLGAVVVYPVFATIRYSLFNDARTAFVGLSNYKSLFSTDSLLTAFRNNIIWVIIFPFFVTFFGLVFAVLTERIRWSTAFKTIIVMPIVFSMTASALVWASIFNLDPHVGAANAALQAVSDWFSPPGAYPVNTSAGQTVASLASAGDHLKGGNLVSTATVSPGGTIRLGLIGISPQTLQTLDAKAPVAPQAAHGTVTGLAWRDFSPSHPTSRTGIYKDEQGLPDLHVSLVKADGSSVASAVTDAHGTFHFSGVPPGTYHVAVNSSNFSSGFTGVYWLGSQSVTPTSSASQTAQALLSVPLIDLAMIIAYLWIWSGFSMVIIGAGLAALDRQVLEAARVDGATEWQTFRRVTMPLLAPVLTVVFVTMVINSLKVFDIVLNMAPGASQESANTLAVAIYDSGFSGGIHTGLASAIAVILFVLVVPIMVWNLKKLKATNP